MFYLQGMREKYISQIDIEELDPLHDVIVMATDKVPTETELKDCVRQLPWHIVSEAISYGWNDTEVRENAYRYIESKEESNDI